jgi:hypothetical protein
MARSQLSRPVVNAKVGRPEQAYYTRFTVGLPS